MAGEITSPTELTLPEALIKELTKMRRDPSEFTGVVANCKFCVEKGLAINLTHADVKEAGQWCSLHGWIMFASPQLPPKETP